MAAPAPLCLSAPATSDQLHAVAPRHCYSRPSLTLQAHCQLTVLNPPLLDYNDGLPVQGPGPSTISWSQNTDQSKTYQLLNQEVPRRLLPRVDAQRTGQDHAGSFNSLKFM